MRLIDIIVDEVSLVDKAANRKSFAFVKREQAQEVAKADAAPPAAPAPAAPAAIVPASPPAETPANAGAPDKGGAVATIPAPAPEGAVPVVAKPAEPEWTADNEKQF